MNPFLKFNQDTSILLGSLDSLKGSYIPDKLPHREMEIDFLVKILASVMRDMKPSNVIVYGKTGTGKTSVVRLVSKLLQEAAGERVRVMYLNCQIYDSPYSILINIVNSVSDPPNDTIPQLGWPLDRIYQEAVVRLEKSRHFYLLVLDEIDKIVTKSGGDSLYSILKLLDDTVSSKLSLIGITNDTGFTEKLDPRVKSRLNNESLMFSPYNAVQIKDILKYRIEGIIKEGVVEESALNLCAAIGAQEHGDARKSLDLLRIAVELAIRDGKLKVTETEIYAARDKFDMNVLEEAIRSLPLHSKLVLLSATITQEMSRGLMMTGEIFENYRNLCFELGFSPLSSRRISDVISELEEFGLLNSSTRSLGRYGRTRFIKITGESSTFKKYLLEDDNLASFRGSRIVRQSRFENLSNIQDEKDQIENLLKGASEGERGPVD
ncbi:MAG: ORC1-type DNA replication protein [Thermoplasmataceae archaeon]